MLPFGLTAIILLGADFRLRLGGTVNLSFVSVWGALTKLKPVEQRPQSLHLLIECVARSSRLFDHCRILLRRVVHIVNRRRNLFQSTTLLVRRSRYLFHTPVYPIHTFSDNGQSLTGLAHMIRPLSYLNS